MQIDIGIAPHARERLAAGFSRLLADSYALYLKSQNFHWNVTGPRFQSLHSMFEEHYTELAPAIDEIAERIRSLGHPAPGGFTAFSDLTSISDAQGAPEANQMVALLVKAHEATARTARDVVAMAEAASDAASADLATQRLQVHEKTAWMLRSSLEQSVEAEVPAYV
jgi:starvation-inducible DNA-binding protein